MVRLPASAASTPTSATRASPTMDSSTTGPQLPATITYPRLPSFNDSSDDGEQPARSLSRSLLTPPPERCLTASDSSCSSEDLAKSLGPTPSYDYDYPESILEMGPDERILRAGWLSGKTQVARTQESSYGSPSGEATPQGTQHTGVPETDYGSSQETKVTETDLGSFGGDGTTTYLTAPEYQPTPASQIPSFNPEDTMDLNDLPVAQPQEPLFSSSRTMRINDIPYNSSCNPSQGAEIPEPCGRTESEFSDLWTDSRHERERLLDPSAYSTPRTAVIAASSPSPRTPPKICSDFSSPPSPSPKTQAALDSLLMPPPSVPASQLSQPGSITGRTQPKSMREATQREKLSLHESFESGLFIDKNMRNVNQLAADNPKWGIRPFEEVKHLYPKGVEGLRMYLKEHCEKDPHCPTKRLAGHEGFWVRVKKGVSSSDSGGSANMNGWGIGK